MYRTGVLVTALFLAVAALLAAGGREAARAKGTGNEGKVPERAGGRIERCVSCHVRADEDPGGAHARSALGCASCHLGNPLAFEKERAHAGMEPEPGALQTAALTCGREGCHPSEAARVASSLMARGSGIIAVDRFAFGETSSPDGDDTMVALLAKKAVTPAEDHLQKLCAGCHLFARRANRDDAIRGNGSGCAACHVARRKEGEKRAHPPIDSRASDDRCYGCHSRSGRISLTYDGLFEVEPAQEATTTLEDGRRACRAGKDVHRDFGLGCVDCHLHTDLMGDGNAHRHKEDQVEITCEACHGPVRPGGASTWGEMADPVTKALLARRKEARLPDESVRLGRRGTPVWNLRPDGQGGWVLITKSEGKRLPVKRTPQDRNHRLKGHERLSCSACHAAWAPRCDTCHVAHDPAGQWDFAAGRETAGKWTEESQGFSASPPALGVRADGTIVPAIPGMLMTVEPGPGLRHEVRLYAPIEPHSTGRRARTCASCHTAEASGLVAGHVPWSGTRTGFRQLDPEALTRLAAVSRTPSYRADFPGPRRPALP